MLYLNQLDYAHVPYFHNTDNGGPPEGRISVKTSGCGLCCACMIVEHLTTHSLSIEDCVRLSESTGANHGIGTDMKILAPVISDMFGLEFSHTTDREEMIRHLQSGGEIIAHVGCKGDKPGLFTKRGHYITVISVDRNEVCILDPSYSETKFETEDRRGRVRINAPFIYCTIDTLMGEIKGNGFYMFKRA